jgi:hypothetical protein
MAGPGPDGLPAAGPRTGPQGRVPAPGRGGALTGAAPGGWIGPLDATGPQSGIGPALLEPADGQPGARPGRPRSAAASAGTGLADPETRAEPGRRDPKPGRPKLPGRGRNKPDAATPGPAATSTAAPGLAPASPEAPAGEPARKAASPVRRAAKPLAGRLATRQRASRKRVIRVYAISAGVAIIAGTALVLELLPHNGPAHTISAPQQLGPYTQEPALAKTMKAAQLRSSIVAQSDGEASHVVAAVYETAGATPGGAAASPSATPAQQIVLFIGGNLAGTSPSSFISSFIGSAQGAVTTSAGQFGGEAACIPGAGGNPAECAWADDDTFGLVASPTLSTQALAAEMRQMRLQVEHRVK